MTADVRAPASLSEPKLSFRPMAGPLRAFRRSCCPWEPRDGRRTRTAPRVGRAASAGAWPQPPFSEAPPGWRSASANSAATALSSLACAAWNPEPDGVQPIDPFIPPFRQPLPARPRTSGNLAWREPGRSTGRRRRAAGAPASCTRCSGRRPDASGRRRRETASRRLRRCARSTWKMTSPRSRFERPFSSRAKSSMPLE